MLILVVKVLKYCLIEKFNPKNQFSNQQQNKVYVKIFGQTFVFSFLNKSRGQLSFQN